MEYANAAANWWGEYLQKAVGYDAQVIASFVEALAELFVEKVREYPRWLFVPAWGDDSVVYEAAKKIGITFPKVYEDIKMEVSENEVLVAIGPGADKRIFPAS